MASFWTVRMLYNAIFSYLDGKTLRIVLMQEGHTELKTLKTLDAVKASRLVGPGVSIKSLANVTITENDGSLRGELDADDPEWVGIDPTTNAHGGYVFEQVTRNNAVTGGDQGTKTVYIAGDQTADYFSTQTFSWGSSTGNDGTYIISSASYNGGSDRTEIVTVEALPHATMDGTLTVDDADQCDLIAFGDLANVDPAGNTLTLQLATPMGVLNA